ncbi:MAG: glutamate--tRNA ligase [Candidatus Aenigmarchaeota archaeon]|nr:glutamate--tRNA ligase [Candidatus Aenigmarchaeota archaeon]
MVCYTELNIIPDIRKHALANAVDHNGKANAGSVIGKLIAEKPELKQSIQEWKPLVEKIVSEINTMLIESQRKELKAIGYVKEEKEEKEKTLPVIDFVPVVRIAPNPDGAIHIGNARPAVLSDEYRKQYKGKFILRFDDTDPKVKTPEKKFYKIAEDSLKWLGIKWDKKIIASSRLNIYYKYAEQLVKDQHAYVCTCNPVKWKALKDKCQACPCRSLDNSEQMKRWKTMLNANNITKSSKDLVIGKMTELRSSEARDTTKSRNKIIKSYKDLVIDSYKEGEAVLRIKTDLNHPNPAIRDWAAMRIVGNPKHPFSKAHVWPLYNLASAIDDHLTRVNLVLRAQEHATNETKQNYLYNYLGWKPPKVMILGRFLFREFVLSKSLTRKGIAKKIYTDWDDPKLGTLMALKRRGFSPQAIRNFIISIGVKSGDAIIAFENLAAFNKKIIDPMANRYFFVSNAQKIRIKSKSVIAKLPLHPNKRKKRILKAGSSLLISANDLEDGKEARLIGLYNIILRKNTSCTVINNDLEYAKGKHLRKIHWLPDDKKQIIKASILTPTGSINGFVERNIIKEKPGSVIQLERFGFARIEKKSKNKIFLVFAHV